MNTTQLDRSRLIVGLILIVIAVLIFLFGGGRDVTASAVALGILGLITIAISRRNK